MVVGFVGGLNRTPVERSVCGRTHFLVFTVQGLFDFLLQSVEEIGIEKLSDADLHPIAQFLDRCHTSVVRPAVYDVADRGLRYAGDDAHFVNGHVTL